MNDKYMQFMRTSNLNTDLFIYGDIRKPSFIERWYGEDESRVDALTFAKALEEVDTPNLTIRINSCGGSVSEALAIYSLLADCPKHKITKVDGFACSAASVIFMVGDERIVPESGLIMIHNAWSEASGDANALRKAADNLEIITSPSLEIYASKTKLSKEKLKEMMAEETWITSQMAFEYGFATILNKDPAMQSTNPTMLVKNLVDKLHKLKDTNCKLTTKINELEAINTSTDPWDELFT